MPHYEMIKTEIIQVYNPNTCALQLNITRLEAPFPSACWNLTTAEARLYSAYSEQYNASYDLHVCTKLSLFLIRSDVCFNTSFCSLALLKNVSRKKVCKCRHYE